MIAIVAIVVCALAVVSLCLFSSFVGDLGRTRPVRPIWYAGLVATWFAGLLGICGGLVAGFVSRSRSRELSDWQVYFSLLAGVPLGATIGPALTYLWLRTRTARDPDYEDYHRK